MPKIEKSLKEIAKQIGAEVIGDETTLICGFAGIDEAQEGEITFLGNPRYKPLLRRTNASAVLVSAKEDLEGISIPALRCDNPSIAFTKVISLFLPEQNLYKKGISKKADIHPDAKIGSDVYIGPFVVIESGAVIGDGCSISANVFLGKDVEIGKNSTLFPNVTIREGSQLGQRVIIHSGTVIGSDGFGYIEVAKRHHKIPQVGIVVIDDDVEIGANVAIDRARFDKTVIGAGTKIDNLVQIAHNVIIGENCIVVSQAGISGSAKLGKNVIVAGQAGLVGHIELGDNAIVGAQAGVSKSVPDNTVVLGAPARPMSEQKRIFASIAKLPEILETVKKLKDKVFKKDGK